MMMGISSMGMMPRVKGLKMVTEVGCVGVGLWLGLPLSVATFPNLTVVKGNTCEPEFHKYEKVYFNRGM